MRRIGTPDLQAPSPTSARAGIGADRTGDGTRGSREKGRRKASGLRQGEEKRGRGSLRNQA